MLLNFGQPLDGITQTAFVVPDLQAAIDRWVIDLGVGPWFVRDRLEGLDPVYRGAPATSAVALAMAFAGHMQIELIEPLNDAPSIYKETIEARGYGFHHFGLAASDFAATLSRLRAAGYEEAYRAGVPTGGEVVFFDTKGALPGFLEVFEATPTVEEVFTRFHLASVGWKGENPVRPFM